MTFDVEIQETILNSNYTISIEDAIEDDPVELVFNSTTEELEEAQNSTSTVEKTVNEQEQVFNFAYDWFANIGQG